MSLAPFTLHGHNPDILTCIANLSNDKVFTLLEFVARGHLATSDTRPICTGEFRPTTSSVYAIPAALGGIKANVRI